MKVVYAIEEYINKLKNNSDNIFIVQFLMDNFRQRIEDYTDNNKHIITQQHIDSLINYKNGIYNFRTSLIFPSNNQINKDKFHDYITNIMTNINDDSVNKMLKYVFEL